MKSIRLTIATIVAGSVLALSGPALAEHASAGPPIAATTQGQRLEAAKARCTAAIDQRITTLDRLSAAVGRARPLTDAHRSTLTTLISDARSGLEALKPQVAAATTAEQLSAACEPVVPAYRVYRLRVPQTRMVIAIDTAGAVAGRLGSVADRLDQAVETARSQGKDTAAAEAALTTMRAEIDRATGLLAGDADAVLAITPAQINDDLTALAPFRGDLDAARDAFRAAVRAARSAAQALRSA